MADIWQTIEQAAVTLGLSVRTVNRHITAGKLESRLFEGRREVRIPSSAIFNGAPASSPAVGEMRSTSGSVGGTANRPSAQPSSATAETSTDTATAAHHETQSNGATTHSPNGDDASRGNGDAYTSANRQRVTADVSSDRPMDANTLLALADSLDDKATLAVAAYQTLARSAESQVQSLRKVALGAWAAVGVMAAGVIVAVGWGTYRLTNAEVTATNLRERVQEQAQKIESQSAGHDQEVARVAAERDAAREELLKTKVEMASTQGALSEAHKNQAELANFMIRQASATRPTTEPSGHAAAGTTQPATADTSANGATSRPIVKTPGQRPTYMTNSTETFDPK